MDGSQYHDRNQWAYEVNVHFGGHNLAYAQYARNLFETFFNKKFRLAREKSGVFRLRIRSKKIFSYFSTYIDYLPQRKHVTVHLKTLEIPSAFKIGFLRGLFDTDGCVYLDKHRVGRKTYKHYGWTITSYSVRLIEDIIQLLKQLGFSPTHRTSQKSVFLRRQGEIARYFHEIKTHNPKHAGRYRKLAGGEPKLSDRGVVETRCTRKAHVGSNPTPSADLNL